MARRANVSTGADRNTGRASRRARTQLDDCTLPLFDDDDLFFEARDDAAERRREQRHAKALRGIAKTKPRTERAHDFREQDVVRRWRAS